MPGVLIHIASIVPTASIAVRGTEFSVTVDTQGDTQVMVYEGAVEVTSLNGSAQSVVVEAGRGVLLVPGQGFQLFNVPAPREIAEQNQGNGRGDRGSSAANTDGHTSQMDADSPRNIASIYEQYIAGLSDIGQVPFLLRYNAFAEPHLDSLENPAYATGFKTAEARVILLPSLNGSGGLDENPSPPGLSVVSPLNYSAAGQMSIFIPLASSFVIGGSVTGSAIGSGVQGVPSDLGLSSILGQAAAGGSLQASGSSTGEFFSGSFLVARRFGSQTSVGVEVESLRGNGSLAAQILSTGQTGTSIESLNSASTISQRRTTIGVERDLLRGHKLSLFYRYGFIDADNHEASHTVNNLPEPLDTTRSSGHTSEFGLRLRGPFRPEVFLWRGGVLARDGAQRRLDEIDCGRFASARPRAAKLRCVGLWLFSQPADPVEPGFRRRNFTRDYRTFGDKHGHSAPDRRAE